MEKVSKLQHKGHMPKHVDLTINLLFILNVLLEFGPLKFKYQNVKIFHYK